MTRKGIAIEMVKDQITRRYLYYVLADLAAIILWIVGQDHAALGAVIISVAWAWTPSTLKD